MKITIGHSLSGTISTGDFENLKPSFSITAEYKGNINIDKKLSELEDVLRNKLEKTRKQAEIKKLLQLRKDIRIYEKDGVSYPSVTSILNWEGLDVPENMLSHYASRGTIVHKLIEIYLKTGEWKKPRNVVGLKSDVALLKRGFFYRGQIKKLEVDDCNFIGFHEKYGKDFEYEKLEQAVYNKKFMYAGRLDAVGKYKGKKAVFDFKTSSTYDKAKTNKFFKQLSAYAKALKGVKTMVIIPLKPSSKTGYGAPIVSEDIDKHFEEFIFDREEFQKVFDL